MARVPYDSTKMRAISAATCVYIDGKPWCNNHGGRPRVTLDTYPQKCADCYDKIAKEIGISGKMMFWSPETGWEFEE